LAKGDFVASYSCKFTEYGQGPRAINFVFKGKNIKIFVFDNEGVTEKNKNNLKFLSVQHVKNSIYKCAKLNESYIL